MKVRLEENQPYGQLNLNGLGLTSLPESLPASLMSLDVSGNQLTSLPENLHASLRFLHANRNRLTSLPENLPPLLERINAQNNQLTSLPEQITTALGPDCHIRLDGNPLSERVRNNLHATVNAEGYAGPRFEFSMATALDATVTRPLEHAISDWVGEGGEHVAATWRAFADQDEAGAFSQFLDRLRGTVNYGNPAFRQTVVEWLSHLAVEPQLRNATFQVSSGATASCEDRVSLTFNEMKKVRLAADVERGHYDTRLEELIPLARGMFRLDKLEKIAREKARLLKLVDEIEVYLAYQVKLRERLDLPLDTPDMRYFKASYVTEEDLNRAEHSVKAAENAEFNAYLSTDWQPWKAVLTRLHANQYEVAQTKLIDAMGADFSARLDKRLKEDGLENNDDARCTVGPQVLAEITHEINDDLTRDFLTNKNLSHLLNPQW